MEQYPGLSSAGTGLPARSDSTNYRHGSARGVPGEGTAIWGCLPPTALTSQADRLLVTNHPCWAGLLGPTGRAGAAKRVQTRDGDQKALQSGHASKAQTPVRPSTLLPTVPLTTRIKPIQHQAA